MSEAEAWLASGKARVEAAMLALLPGEDSEPARLHEAMRYAALNGGKRFRAGLIYAAGAALNAPADALDRLAAAVEFIHAYSLVHDDLPAMDDDGLRRGLPTLHVAWDEATAILAGDALQALAFEALARPLPAVSALAQLQTLNEVAFAIGSMGMAGGQAMDIEAEGRKLPVAALEGVHQRKTGRLIQACVVGAAHLAGSAETTREALATYALHLGLAYQVHDDVLDETSDTATLGKTAGADARREKSTYPSCLGIDGSQQLAERLCDQAITALPPLPGDASALVALARWAIARHH